MAGLKRLGVITSAVILFLVSGSPAGAAGLGKILGSVKNEKGMPLSGADISLLAVKAPSKVITVHADTDGKFRIDKLPPGQYAVRISQNGYKPIARPPVKVAAGHSTPLHLILQLTEFIAMDPNPNNWDIRTVLKAAQDRRLIFRDHDGSVSGAEAERASYNSLLRNSALRLSTSLGEPYTDRRMARPGISFAYAPLTFLDSKYTMAGQWNPVENAVWKIKNMLDYRLSDQQNLRISMGYGKTGLFASKNGARSYGSNRAYHDDFSLVQTFSVNAENQVRFSDLLTVVYGVGFDQVRSFDTRAYVHPEIQVMFAPHPDWTVRGRITARRDTEATTLVTPEGETIHVNDPLSIVQAGRQILWNGSRHYEVGVTRRLPDQSELAVSTYADRTFGRLPVFGTFTQPGGDGRARLFQLGDHQADSEGLRVAYSKHLFDGLSGSVAYVYATGAEVPKEARAIPLSQEHLMDLNRRGSFHLISTRIETGISKTGTKITTIFKWMPRKPINTLDPFSDNWDVANGGVNLFIRQYLPVPLFLNLFSGWEASVDVRNLIDQNNGILVTSSGETIVLKNPRSFRGGILFRF